MWQNGDGPILLSRPDLVPRHHRTAIPGPSGLGQLTPKIIAAISTAVTQALQAAAATLPVQFVSDAQVPVGGSSVQPRNDFSVEVQPDTEASGAVQGTVQTEDD